MTVSIIIPVYNAAQYIKRCLNSVVKQTFQDVECILVDDCGLDNSMNIATEFINKYEGNITFSIIRHECNKGQSAARNTALHYAKGDYIYFLDSDDSITFDCIEKLHALVVKYPNVDFAQGNILDDKGKISYYGWHSQLPEYCNNHENIEKYFLSVVVTSAWNKLIRKSFLLKYRLFFPEGIVHEDLFWSFILVKHTKSVAFENSGTYCYYINNNSTMNNLSAEARIKRYKSRLYASSFFCKELNKQQKTSIYQRHFVAGNLTSAMIEISALHSIYHWGVFWRHVITLYLKYSKLTFWQHILFLFMMPPLCFPICYKAWYWRLHKHIVNRI